MSKEELIQQHLEIEALKANFVLLESKLESLEKNISVIDQEIDNKLQSENSLIWGFIGGLAERLEVIKPEGR